ncbi:hypothetical protein OTK49_01050 [Vibrio coralliirubri]|uniref:hypothetical protein n=1 Tax=Vibrio coralliirubri TaxID=1516159 RepID=UPI0022843BB7|nr:hypothetical protein [Vibrio coralliirubri]MCY9861116.1 hypothetical protein [Vibrio coralliirubri]
MGSFSYTCAVTHTPILEGNNVRVIFGSAVENNDVLRTYSRDTFQPFGLSLKATYGKEGDGNFIWQNDEANYFKGETRCHCVTTRILRAICKEAKLTNITLEDVIHTIRSQDESDEIGVRWMVIHEDVYQSIVTDYPISGYSHKSLKAFYEQPKIINKIELAEFQVERYVAKKLEMDGTTHCEEMRKFFTSSAEEYYGSNVALNYFSGIYSASESIIGEKNMILSAVSINEIDVFDNAAELLSFCRFMESHNLPMVKSQATRLVSIGAHVHLYEKMAKWCRDIQAGSN